MSAFGEWLAVAKRTDDPAGDLLDDLRNDAGVEGRDFFSCSQLEAYVRRAGGCAAAVDACAPLWRRFWRWLNRV